MDTIKVYVRLPSQPRDDQDVRHLTFRIPGGLTAAELLDAGWAIDGNQAIRSVEASFDELKGHTVSMPAMLREAQQDVIKLLGKHDYAVEFA